MTMASQPVVVLLGTLDTKGAEYAFLRDRLQESGCDVVLVDAGILDPPTVAADIGREEVAAAAGVILNDLVSARDRGAAVEAMGRGASIVVRKLHDEGRLHTLVGLGGSGGSSLVSTAMRGLPVGVPKLLVSTMAAGDTRPYVGSSDLALLYPVVDVAGINRITHRLLTNVAAAAAGMAHAALGYEAPAGSRPLLGASMFGVTTPCVTAAREWLEDHGYEVLVFHATGTGGQAMEALMRSGFITGALDITTTELADELVGGVLSAGPERLEAAGRLGLPQVVSVGALDMVNFGPRETVPARFADRRFHVHNPTVTLMRTTPQECAELGRTIARKLSLAKGPVSLFLPLRGVSQIDVEGQPFHDRAADAALFDALREGVSDRVEIIEIDTDINDASFAVAMARRLDEQYRTWAES